MASISNRNFANRSQIENSDVYVLFEPFLNQVLRNKFGIFLGAIELRNVSSSCDDGRGDRFRISIPYANHRLDWMVMFNSLSPQDGPDFEFADKSFLSDPDMEIMEQFIPSLYNWDCNKPDGLLRVLTEFVIHYKKHQLDQMKELNDHLLAEYTMLTTKTEISQEDIEVILTPDGIQPTEAHFLIRLAADFSKLPEKHIIINDTAAVLHVTFRGPHWTRSSTELHLSDNLQEVFTNPNSIQLPPFALHKSLMDFVPEVKQLLNNKINSIITTFDKKSAFISAVLFLQGNSVIEYDAIDFNYVIILLETSDFHFLVQFNLPPTFPADPPRVTLQSAYFMSGKHDVYKHLLDNIPYSPRWEPKKMFTKAITHIMEKEVNRFKDNSTKRRR